MLKKNRDHVDNCIVEISQNTEKSFGVMRIFAVTQTPVKNLEKMIKRDAKLMDYGGDSDINNTWSPRNNQEEHRK